MNRLLFILLFSIAATACGTEPQKNTAREVKASEIIAMVDRGENICLDSCIVYGDLDFTAVKKFSKIAPEIGQIYIDCSLTFIRCIFLGKISAYAYNPMVCTVFGRNLSFIDCDFRNETDFTECTVEGNAFFSGSVFRKKSLWQAAYFKYKVAYFTRTVFEDEAMFQNSVYAGDVHFVHARFEKSAMFQGAVAAGLMMFGAVYFGGYVDFSYARADESVFKYAEFKDRTDFANARIGNGVNEALKQQSQ
ncbi:MAG: pentapeptide repeat-containing protein [Prevotellaceae bacterium]|jgi:hypothetical protein|nr:pentapeptide repeat-containing protein [Prevotellaceae bacterium]